LAAGTRAARLAAPAVAAVTTVAAGAPVERPYAELEGSGRTVAANTVVAALV
jgi:hypothetical protein